MPRTDKLLETLRTTKVVSVRAVFVQQRVRAEWEGIGLDELRECFHPEATFEVRGKIIIANLGRMPKVVPGDMPLGPAAEMLRNLVVDPTRVKLNKLAEADFKTPLVRLMSEIIALYELRLDEALKDPKIFGQVQLTLARRKKRMAVKAVQSVFRRAVHLMNTEEIHEMWNIAQVESVLKS